MFSCAMSILSVQSTTFWSGHLMNLVHCDSKGGQTDCLTKGYKNPEVPGWSEPDLTEPVSSTHSGSFLSGLGWLVNMEKSELDPKQIFDFVSYQFDLKQGKVRPTLECWQTLNAKIQKLLSRPTCPVSQLMSLIGLLTATEKQVHLGRLHMRPI